MTNGHIQEVQPTATGTLPDHHHQTRSLTPHHLADLRHSGLTDTTIAAAGLYSATPDQVKKILNRDVGSGLVFPYLPLNGRKPFMRVKPDSPPTVKGKPAKYLTRSGAGNRLYVPPAVRPSLEDPSMGLIITGGEKKALKAAQEGFNCIGLAGVYSFLERTAKGKSRVIPDFDQVIWQDRLVHIVFDSALISASSWSARPAPLNQPWQRFF